MTGSAGHLGEALARELASDGEQVVGLDLVASPHTDAVGSILDRSVLRSCLEGVDAVIHAATLHKPHIGTHDRQAFVDTNISGTLNLLEEAAAAGVRTFVFTSTTSTYGGALNPPPGAPAAWITEQVAPVPKNIYGATKTAAEDLCALYHREGRIACLVLRVSRFFPEVDDSEDMRTSYEDLNFEGQRAALPTCGHRRRRERPPFGTGARWCDRLRSLHHQRHDPLLPRRPR